MAATPIVFTAPATSTSPTTADATAISAAAVSSHHSRGIAQPTA